MLLATTKTFSIEKNLTYDVSACSKTPRFGSARTSDALMSLSPAARLLMKNKLGIRTPGRDSPLTPSPAVKK